MSTEISIGKTYNLPMIFYSFQLSLQPEDDGKTRDMPSTRTVFDKSPLFNEEFIL